MISCDNDLLDDEEATHYAYFVDCTPMRYEEVAKDPKWVKPMDEEINAIEKKQHLEAHNSSKGKDSNWSQMGSQV